MRIPSWSFLLGFWCVAGTANAQLYGGTAVTPNPSYDGRFTFARLRYAGSGCMSDEGPGWHHDYRVAEQHLMQIMTELTSLDGRVDSSVVFNPDDPGLMQYPVAYLSEPGCWQLSEPEVAGLRTYLRKGGFLIVDDFSGGDPDNLERQMQRVLPEGHFVPIKPSDPIFNLFLELDAAIDQVMAGSPLSRIFGGGRRVEFRGIYEDDDPTKRLMVIANYNADIGDYWQWSGNGMLPVAESNEAYKIGVNYIVYGLTH